MHRTRRSSTFARRPYVTMKLEQVLYDYPMRPKKKHVSHKHDGASDGRSSVRLMLHASNFVNEARDGRD